jgi:diguanylate cyclase (GGDEF)-like protein
LNGLTRGRAAVSATDEAHGPAGIWRVSAPPQSLAEAIDALIDAEARLCMSLQGQERLRADNESLRKALETASRRAVAAQREAHRDGLTGLPNRLFLIRRLQQAIVTAGQRNRKLALLFIDLDGFKAVNDGLGHAVADRLLATVAARIAACVRSDDIACRYGGDEFVALLTDLNDASIAIGVSQRIRGHIAESYMIDDNETCITASIGLAVYPSHGERYDALLNHADSAMYRDKAARFGHARAAHSAVAT